MSHWESGQESDPDAMGHTRGKKIIFKVVTIVCDIHVPSQAQMGHVHEMNKHKLSSGVLAVISQDWVGVPDGATSLMVMAHAYGVTAMGSLCNGLITEGGSIFFRGC